MSRTLAKLVPHYAYDDARLLPRRRCERGDRRAAPRRLRAAVARAQRRGAAHARAHRRGHLAHLRPAVHRELPRALPVQPARQGGTAGGLLRRPVGGRAGHRSRRQCPLRPHRLLRRQPPGLRLLQGLHGARRGPRRRARPGAGPLPVAGRRQCRAAGAHLRQGRGLVPHVGDRGGHAGRAARPLSHRPQPRRGLLRRLSRLVGRRAAGRRQSGAGARDLHPGRHVGAHLGRAAHAARHCLRAGQPRAGDVPQQRRAGRFRPWSRAARTKASIAPPTRPGSRHCAPSAPSAASC